MARKPELRRRSNRYPLNWKAAVVFESSHGRPVIHTQTEDLSVGGAAIFTEHGDLTGSVVHLLLAFPAGKAGNAPKVLKVRARVVSTARTPGMSQYRHGLSFLRSPDDGLDALDLHLGSAEPAMETLAQPAAPAAGNRLAQLKQLAQIKTAAGKPVDTREAVHAAVSDALVKAHRYLTDLVTNLNVVRPAFPRGYGIAGVPEFSGLAWEHGDTDFHMREMSPAVKLHERVTLRFTLSGKKQIRAARDYPAADRLKQLLEDSNLAFEAQSVWSKRGSLERTTFVFPCEVSASLLLQGQFDTGKLLLRARNVSGFGSMEQILAPQAISDESLDELAAFILGETGRLGPLLLRGA